MEASGQDPGFLALTKDDLLLLSNFSEAGGLGLWGLYGKRELNVIRVCGHHGWEVVNMSAEFAA